MTNEEAKKQIESTPSWVLVDADGIEIFISKDDPWFNDLVQKFPKYTEVEGPIEVGDVYGEDDFDIDVDYSNDDI